MQYCVYEIRCKSLPEIYIGSSACAANRIQRHLSDLSKNKHHNKKLQKHYNKYGIKDLIFTVIELFDSKEEMLKYEKEQIKNSNNLLNSLGYKEDHKDDRDEFVYILSEEGYTQTEIGDMFNLNRSTTKRILDAKPKDYKAKWIKAPQ